MDKELEDKIHQLGSFKGGQHLRIAYNISNGMTHEEACKAEGYKSFDYLHKIPTERRDLILDVASDLAINRIVDAEEQAAVLIKNAATKAVRVLEYDLEHRNPNIRQKAANSILDRLKEFNLEVDAVVQLSIGEKATRALKKAYGNDDATDHSDG